MVTQPWVTLLRNNDNWRQQGSRARVVIRLWGGLCLGGEAAPEGRPGRASLMEQVVSADATCLLQLANMLPNKAGYQHRPAVHLYRISILLPGLPFYIPQRSRF